MGRAHARETHETKGGAAVDIFVVHDEVIAADLPAVTLSAPCEAAARVRERQRCAEPARRVNPAGAGLHAPHAASAVARDRAVHIGDARHGLHPPTARADEIRSTATKQAPPNRPTGNADR